MKTILTFVFIFAVFSNLQSQQEQTLNIPSKEEMKQMIIDQKVPAVALGIIDDGKITHFMAEGKNHLNLPVNKQTIFDVASLTKTITTLVTLKLVESGAWNIDTPLHSYWIDPDVKEDERHKKLTTRHILSHRSGFLNWRWMDESKKLSFQFEPGEKFGYSGEGYEYLRKALEVKFQTSLEKLADSLVFAPLQMKKTSLIWHEKLANDAFAGNHDKEAKPYEYEKSYQANAADNLLTTVSDFSVLGAAILNQSFLKKETFEAMIQSESYVREGIHFGLGWILFKDLQNDQYALFNAGSDQGVNALIVLFPTSRQGMVVLTNGDNGRPLVMRLIARVFGDRGKEILGRF